MAFPKNIKTAKLFSFVNQYGEQNKQNTVSFSKQVLLCAIKLYGGVDDRLGIGD